jgi:hypothetical protein
MASIVKINAGKIIEIFGGVTAVCKKFTPYKDISRSGIEKWRERHSIPGDALLIFLLLAKKENIKLDLTTFVERK